MEGRKGKLVFSSAVASCVHWGMFKAENCPVGYSLQWRMLFPCSCTDSVLWSITLAL